MTEIERWFQRTASPGRQPVSLYSCFLTGRVFAYFRYRLRYSLLLATVQFVVHVAEFLILISALGGLAAFTVMVLRAGSVIIAGGWWGLLEIMRDRLRDFSRAGDRDASGAEIGRWLVLSLALAVLMTLAGGVALILMRSAGDPVARLYSFLLILELAIGFPVRVLHSGVYATRRVYKPVWSMFAPTVAQLVVLGCGFYLYPTAALIVAILASNAIGIWVTVHYAREVYRLVGLWPRWPSPDRGLRQCFPRIPPWLGFETMLSGASFHLDAALVLALVGFYGTDTRTFDLTAGLAAWQHVDAFRFFYLIMPLFRGTYESAGIFYFDFARLRGAPGLREMKLRFFQALLWVAPAMALYFWVLAAALGMFVLHDIPITFLLALIPMFILRSLIGLYQIRLFAEGRFGTHIATLLMLLAMLWLVWMNPNPAADLIQITAAMIAQLIVLINAQHLRDRTPPGTSPLIPLRDWTRSLTREPGPLAVGSMTVPKAVTTKQRSAVVALMHQTFSGTGHFAFQSPTKLVYHQRSPDSGDERRTGRVLQSATGGAARLTAGFHSPNGLSARDRLLDTGWWDPDHDGPGILSITDLSAEFRALFDDGIAFDMRTLAGARDMRALDPAVLARALPTALSGREIGADVIPVAGRLMTPVFRCDTLRMLFVLPTDPDPNRLRSWRHVLRVWSHG